LLLTFFYRQMPEVIERGHLFIAQPPLYKVKREGSETYLKDQGALEHYLIDAGVKDAVLTLYSGEQRSGEDLRGLVEEARRIGAMLNGLPPRYPKQAIEQTAIAGALTPSILSNQDLAGETSAYIARRLDRLEDEVERGWQGTPSGDGGLAFTRTLRGVQETIHIDGPLIASADARRLDGMAADLQSAYLEPGILQIKDQKIPIYGPSHLLAAVLDFGRQGVSLQRYKGLGEMNPDQLWQTTLDHDARTLLQVKIRDVADSNNLFEQLMGDVVEPRRQFIQDNALSVANLDI